jgi:hypothetical protein
MNLRDDDVVSAVALVMESAADTSAEVQEELDQLETADVQVVEAIEPDDADDATEPDAVDDDASGEDE